jgi:hypothetical protein
LNLLPDLIARIAVLFEAGRREEASQVVRDARLHDGGVPDARMQRCVIEASRGSMDKLRYYANLLKVDYRDVIVAGEYEPRNGKLVRVRDLTQPLK